MTTESFAEFLNKLKEIHEKEVQGLQSKLTELTTEKCRDTQRIEELFAKNHQLREQQKVLKENIKVLENRLRAGLCDRCMVTQELAKKKQNEYETSHFQSLQHIFILTNETNRLREENKTLKEELKRLQSPEDTTKHLGVTSKESSSTPSSPLALLSPPSRNACTEKAVHKGADEAHQDVPGIELEEDKPAGQRSSPSSRISPGTVFQEVSLTEMASQRISNQLHGTIALVKPASKPCLLEKSPPGSAVSPPARKIPLPPEREHSPSLEAYLAASKPDSPKVTPSYEHLKLSTRREQLCLLHKHLSLHQLGLASSRGSADRDGSSFSSHLLRAKDAEGRPRSRSGWEDRAALLKLPAAMVYVRDQHLEEKLHLLKQRERLQQFLMQQCQASQRAGGDPKPTSEERPLSPWPSIVLGCKEEKSFLEDTADGKEEKELWLSQDSSELREKVKVARDDGADAPLDLSDSSRGRESGWHSRRELQGAGSPRQSPAVPAAHGPCRRHGAEQDDFCFHHGLSKATRTLPGTVEKEEEEEKEEGTVLRLSQAHPTNSSSPSDPEALLETGERPAATVQKEEADDEDAESGKQESDEPDTTDSEVAAPYEDDILQEAQTDGKYFCTKDKAHVLHKKRKRGQDIWTKASPDEEHVPIFLTGSFKHQKATKKGPPRTFSSLGAHDGHHAELDGHIPGARKSMRGRKKVKVEQCSAGVMKEPENCSTSHNTTSEES